jgi:hypothetical protein
MKIRIGILLIVAVCVFLAVSACGNQTEKEEEVAQKQPDKESKIHDSVRKMAKEKGMVEVIITLVQTGEDHDKKAIAKAQAALLAELKGTRHKVLGKSEMFYDIALEVGPYALDILKNSANVEYVSLNSKFGIFLSQSVPLVLDGTSVEIIAGQGWEQSFERYEFI